MRTICELEAWQSLDELSDRDVGDGFQRGQFVLDSVKEGGCILFIISRRTGSCALLDYYITLEQTAEEWSNERRKQQRRKQPARNGINNS
jgi:hypothetical protein